jgi:hypothetical protein
VTPGRLLATAARVAETVWLRTLVLASGHAGMPSRPALPPDDTVSLLDPARRAPATAAERFAVLALARSGPLPRSQLVNRVARELYCDELRQGGAAADIGLPGIALFHPDARRVVEAAQGVLWTVGPPAPIPGSSTPE